MSDVSDEDFENMSEEEWEQYFEDIASGYAFDPDNKILDGDKNMSPAKFFESMNEEIDALPYKKLVDYAKAVSRVSRWSEWLKNELEVVDYKLTMEYRRRMKECP